MPQRGRTTIGSAKAALNAVEDCELSPRIEQPICHNIRRFLKDGDDWRKSIPNHSPDLTDYSSTDSARAAFDPEELKKSKEQTDHPQFAGLSCRDSCSLLLIAAPISLLFTFDLAGGYEGGLREITTSATPSQRMASHLGDDIEENLITLCAHCHQRSHRARP